jgi:hypothetical protein
MPAFRSECKESGLVFRFRLTDLEAEKIIKDDEEIKKKVRSAYGKRFSPEETEYRLCERTS